jgi:hypothetical protein
LGGLLFEKAEEANIGKKSKGRNSDGVGTMGWR